MYDIVVRIVPDDPALFGARASAGKVMTKLSSCISVPVPCIWSPLCMQMA